MSDTKPIFELICVSDSPSHNVEPIIFTTQWNEHIISRPTNDQSDKKLRFLKIRRDDHKPDNNFMNMLNVMDECYTKIGNDDKFARMEMENERAVQTMSDES